MPAYVGFSALDWHYETAPPDLQPAIRVANEDLASRDHTYDTFVERLQAVAAQHPRAMCDAVVEDGYRCMWLIRARDGRVTTEQVFAGDLPWDDAIECEDAILELDHDSEDALAHAARAIAAEGGAGACVASIVESRYLVQITGGNVQIQKLTPAVDATLYRRVYTREYTRVPPPPRDASRRYDVPVYLKADALALIEAEAQRSDRSLSAVVGAAWAHAREVIRAPGFDARVVARAFVGDRAKVTLVLPGDVADELAAVATQIDGPTGLVVMAAIALARDALAQLR